MVPVIAICALCNVTSVSAVIFDPACLTDSTTMIEKFDQFEESLETSMTSLRESRKFLESFLDDINTKHGFNLTLLEACKLIQENVHVLQISSEQQDILLQTCKIIEPSLTNQTTHKTNGLYWPNEWNWFGLNKKKHSNKSQKQCHTIAKSPSLMETELPSNCYVGAIELFVGALIFILPIPGAQIAAITVMGDGGRRVIDGIIQLGEERRCNPDYVCPKLGPPFD